MYTISLVPIYNMQDDCTIILQMKYREYQKYNCLACDGTCSLGQYGHLNLLDEPRMSFIMDVLLITWPQERSIGGESAVLCSRDTGHAKMLWNCSDSPKSTSAVAVSSPAALTICNPASFIKIGNALKPAVMLHMNVSDSLAERKTNTWHAMDSLAVTPWVCNYSV